MSADEVRDTAPERSAPMEGGAPSRERSYGGDRGGSGGFRGRGKGFFRRKVCKFCVQNLTVDYKNPDSLRRFVTERGKILPRRITGTCAKHQRAMANEVKRSRVLAFLPFVKQ